MSIYKIRSRVNNILGLRIGESVLGLDGVYCTCTGADYATTMSTIEAIPLAVARGLKCYRKASMILTVNTSLNLRMTIK